jgi:hypothetical protein
VDFSLVRRVIGPRDEPRYLLLELLRERARDLLTDEEKLTVGQRHAEYVAAMLDDLDERRWVAAADRWIDIITELLTEIRAAHAWAERQDDVHLAARITAGMGTYWHREGHHVEGRRWVAGALAHASDLDEYLVARLELAAGFVEWPRDQLVARNYWAASSRRFRELGHDRYLAYSLAMSAATYIGDADSYDFSIRLCDEGIDLARQVVERPLLAQALNVKGELARVNGDDELARVAYDEGLALASAAHDQTHVCTFLSNLSFLAEHRGDDAEARRLATDALRLSWSIGRRLLTAYTLSKCAGAELSLGRRERAARLIGAADEALRILGVNLHPGDVPEYERVVAALRESLGADAYLALQTSGAQLSLGEAVALALSDDAS